MNELRDYQQFGIDWMAERDGCILADEPGLGKTVQASSLIKLLAPEKPSLIVCPSNMKYKWARHLEDWADIQDVHIYQGLKGDIPEAQAYIINYEIFARRMEDLTRREYGISIVDEAHRIKNHKAKITEALLSPEFKSDNKKLLTGTPIKKSPIDYWTLLHFIRAIKDPDSRAKYALQYCAAKLSTVYLKGGKRRKVWDYSGASNMKRLAAKTSPYILRRKAIDVLPELPEIVYNNIVLDGKPSNLEYKLYKQFQDGSIADPQELEREIKARVDDWHGFIRKSIETKLPHLIKHIRYRLDQTDKVVVFGYHHLMLESLHKAFNRESLLNYGKTDKSKELDVVFQNDSAKRLFVSQFTEGIDLYAANQIVFAEYPWVPAQLFQSIKRCHRYGQTRPVNVDFALLPGSVDSLQLNAIRGRLDAIEEYENNLIITGE